MKTNYKFQISLLLLLVCSLNSISQTNFYDSFSWNGFQGKDFITPPEDQIEQGPCAIFAAIGLVEAMYELLYFSPNANLELSERHLYSPCTDCYAPGIVDVSKVYLFLNDPAKGVVEEASDNSNSEYDYPLFAPYIFLGANCTDPPGYYKYQASSERIYISGFTTPQIQDLIYQVGPLAISFPSGYVRGGFQHSMLLHGWTKISGVLYWKFKDSWPGNPTEEYLVPVSTLNLQSISGTHIRKVTAVRKYQHSGSNWNQVTLTRSCSGDVDCDGYCFWGVGPKPCSHGTSQLQDYNDNNSALGPLQANGNPLALIPRPCSYITAPVSEMVVYGPSQSGSCSAAHTLSSSQLKNVTGDNMDWVPYFGSTPTANTGPDNNAPGALGLYVYLEPTGGCFEQYGYLENKDWIYIPNNSNTYNLNYYYHMYGSTMGNLKVYIQTYPNTTWSERGITKSGNKGNSWFNEIISLNEFKGMSIKLRFKGTTGYGEFSDMALQKITVTSSAMKSTENQLQEENQPTFNIFPNPASHYVEIRTTLDSDYELSIYSILGIEVQNGRYNANHILDVSNLPRGAYFMKIRYSDKQDKESIHNLIIE